jgi:hypothetical protein
MVVAYNVVASSEGYANLMAHFTDPKNGFKTTTAPYAGGLHIAVYVGPTN